MTRVAEVREQLDARLLEACFAYEETNADAPPLFAAEGGLTEEAAAYLHRFNHSLLQMAFVADARARLEPQPAPNTELAWVDVAKRGLRRVGRLDRRFGGCEKVRLFDSACADEQAAIYSELHELRTGGAVPTGSLDYAEGVASGVIRLEEP